MQTRWENRKYSQLGTYLFSSDVFLAAAVVLAKAPFFLVTAVFSKLWSGIYGITSIIINFHIANSAICILNVHDVPSGDVSVTVSTKFFWKKKMVRIKNLVSCTKKELYLWFSTRNDNISRGCVTKMEFPEGMGGLFCEPILEKSREEGVVGKIPSMGGMDIFWNYTLCIYLFK